MEILTHFNKSLKHLDVLLYQISIHLDPLMISKNITEEITSKILTPEISELIDSTTNSLTTLIEKLEPISKTIKRTSYNKPSEPIKPYAPFKIDEAPIVKENHYLLSNLF